MSLEPSITNGLEAWALALAALDIAALGSVTLIFFSRVTLRRSGKLQAAIAILGIHLFGIMAMEWSRHPWAQQTPEILLLLLMQVYFQWWLWSMPLLLTAAILIVSARSHLGRRMTALWLAVVCLGLTSIALEFTVAMNSLSP